MGSVWKRLQRVNKRAAKFQFTVSYHELHLETTAKWRPSNLSVVWTRRSRRVASAPLPWEPDMMNPLIGHITWSVPDNHSISVTLFKDPRTHELEDKDWTFVLEDISSLGKKRILANSNINMKKYASIESTQQSFTLNLKPISRKISSASLELTISCVFLREGKATDEDMQSVVSLMSVNNNCDVAPLDDLEDIPDLESIGDISDHLYDFTQQLEQLTTSLNGCMDLPTPLSVPSLSEDPTPLAEGNMANFANDSEKPNSREEESLKTPNAMNVLRHIDLKAPVLANSIPDHDTFTNNPTESIMGEQTNCNPLGKHEFITSTPLKSIDRDESFVATRIEKNVKKTIDFPHVVDESSENQNESLQNARTANADDDDVVQIKNDKKPNQSMDLSIKENNLDISMKKEDINTKTINECIATNSSPSDTEKIDTKRASLAPLNLRKNYDDNTFSSCLNKSTLSTNRFVEKIVLKENTPGQDLLEWCKEVTKDYPNVKVTNLTTSWRNGIAFCAIIHHFESSLIDMNKLSAHDVVGNCRTAFDAAETLGIPRVIEPRDMSLLAVPDKLAVMTYLHQLRAHFTGKQLQIEQIGPTSDESSYVIGNYKSDNVSQNLFYLSNLNNLNNPNFINDDTYDTLKQQSSPTSKKDVKNKIFTSSKNILGKVLSPTKEKYSVNGINHNSFSLDEEVEKFNSTNPDIALAPSSPTFSPIDPNAANRILSRHKEMSEKAKMMMEKLKISANNEKRENDDLRQQRLREQARRLIIETRTKGSNDNTSPTSPTKPKQSNFIPERTISPIPNGEETGAKVNSTQDIGLSPCRKFGNSSLQSFNTVMDRVSPKIDKKGDKVSYIESELEALEREQEAIDQKASYLEKKLRAVMGGNPSNKNSSFIRLIRNSIGGGEFRRIKLLNTDENNDESNKTLKHSNSDASCSSQSSASSNHEIYTNEIFDINRKTNQNSNNSYRERSKSCILDPNENNKEFLDSSNDINTLYIKTCSRKSLEKCSAQFIESDETEEQLLAQWFTLVNKKNALLRRQMQLNILEQESDLELKYNMLNQELRAAQSVEDWRKTEAQREKERLLLEELVAIVDKRDQLVQHLHSQEIAIEDDHEIARELEQVDISGNKEKCLIQ